MYHQGDIHTNIYIIYIYSHLFIYITIIYNIPGGDIHTNIYIYIYIVKKIQKNNLNKQKNKKKRALYIIEHGIQ